MNPNFGGDTLTHETPVQAVAEAGGAEGNELCSKLEIQVDVFQPRGLPQLPKLATVCLQVVRGAGLLLVEWHRESVPQHDLEATDVVHNSRSRAGPLLTLMDDVVRLERGGGQEGVNVERHAAGGSRKFSWSRRE